MAKVAEVGTAANQYQILAKLASGGMAEIFLARGASVAGVERYCVLKRILRERASDAELVQMFVHEARLVAQLHHPNIASVYDIGMLGDSYFFTMEYVHGETIRALLLRARALQRQLPLACVLAIIAGAAAGLHHAHERTASDGRPLGIVHRDVSPSNLMVSYEGNVKVVDFGVAKAEDRTVETRSGTVKGKISYLSPEQCRGARVDRRSDVFSLGIVLWEMLTGERLYRRNSDFDNMTAIVHEPAPPPSAHRSDLPTAIDELAMRLLAKKAADRFQSAAEVVDAIEAASMRTGTILSTSAVSRLVRELFGVRAEPWLALDGAGASHEPSTIEPLPIPHDLGPGPGDAVGAAIVGALDPILSRLVAARRAISMSSASVLSPQIERVTEVAAPGELPAPDETPPQAPSAAAEQVAGSVEPAVPEAPSPGTATSTAVFAPPGRLVAQPAPPARSAAAAAAIAVVTRSPGSTSGPAGSPIELALDPAGTTSSSQAGTPEATAKPASRRLAAMTAVGGAAALGVFSIWLATRPAPDPSPAGHVGRASVPPPDAGARSFDASRAPGTSQTGKLAPGAPEHAADVAYDAARPPVVSAMSARIDKPRPLATDAPPRPHAPDGAISAAGGSAGGAAGAGAGAAGGGGAGRAGNAGHAPPDAASSEPAPPAPVPPGTADSASLESLSRLFRNGDHATVVRICSAAPLSRDIAGLCVMAACEELDAAQAARWLPFDDPAKREQRASFCREHGGADIGNTLDCAANPLDCR